MKPAMSLEKPRLSARRSQRLKLQVPVLVARRNSAPQPDPEHAVTLNVNACGGMFELRMPVQLGELLVVTNKATAEEQVSRVVYVGPNQPHGRKIGVEFSQPAKDFWRIHFPLPGHRTNGH